MTEMAILVDTTKCTGCRACQVACKQWNELPAEKTTFFGGAGYQNPADVSVNTLTVLKFQSAGGNNDLDADGNWNFLKFQCMHCNNALCVLSCPLGAVKRSPEGFTYVDMSLCNASVCDTGLGPVCQNACPYRAAKTGLLDHDNDPLTAKKKVMRKCRGCYDRAPFGLEPACVKTCNTDALQYGERNAIVALAAARAADPDVVAKYPNVNVYGVTGSWGGGHVIYVLAQPPSFYGLPT